jgi:hypothetical protein
MSTDEARHVTTEELVSSVVDEEALSPEARLHLETCPECGRQKAQIMEDLRKLGWSARRFTPEPARKIVIPPRVTEPSRARPFPWALGGLAAAACLAMILVLSPGAPVIPPGGAPPAFTAADLADDAKLMADVSRLAEDALPDAYQEISPEEPMAANEDDDAELDFVVPIDDNGGLT